MKKIVTFSIVFFVLISFMLNVPTFSAIFLTDNAHKVIVKYHGVDPVVNASRFTSCVIDAFTLVSDDRVYEQISNFHDLQDLHDLAVTLYDPDDRSLIYELFVEVLEDLGLEVSSEFDEHFFEYVFELAILKYYNPYEYYLLLDTYGVLDVVGGL